MKAGELISWIEEFAPPETALPEDNVGLMLGAPECEVETVLVALTPTLEVAEEAKRAGAQMLLTHHPVIYEPLKRVTPDSETGAMLLSLASAGIVAYSAHTNLDCAPGGMNAALLEKLGLEQAEPLHHHHVPGLKKLVTFVPDEHLEAVARAMGDAGAGIIGKYSHCSFRLRGTGTYIPLEGAEPFKGEVGKLEKSEETRFEVIVPPGRLDAVVQAMIAKHPYDEIAYDVYPLENRDTCTTMGAVAELPEELHFRDFLCDVKERLGMEAIRFAGDPWKQVKRVAICGGSGSSLLPAVIAARCDAFLTGDIKYHFALDAVQRGIVLADIGHHESELPVVAHLVKLFSERFPDVRFIESKTNTNPFGYA